jgi:hypothetical protein
MLVQADGEMEQLLSLMQHESSKADRGPGVRDGPRSPPAPPPRLSHAAAARATSKIGNPRRRKTRMADPAGLHTDGEAGCESSRFEMAVL